MYNPNPFEFVPFKTRTTIDRAKWDAVKPIYSGWLEVTLTALTPIHIVGKQEPVNNRIGDKIASSSFYVEDSVPTIPGSSIKGMLRAFLEALTCGWVSQVNDEYPKVRGTRDTEGRHVGFGALSNYPNEHRSSIPAHRWIANPVISSMYKPDLSLGKVDVATYMFGIVTEKENSEAKANALRSKVFVEDCPINPGQLSDIYEIPDIEGNSFMGGAHPSASSWWYMLPDEIWLRNTAGNILAEFVGLRYRGRKFYFHQKPDLCIEWYDQNWVRLNQRPDKPPIKYYKYKISCMRPQENAVFRIYIDRLPMHFFALLCLLLSPGQNIKHKLGYGKAYGYGSIKMEITNAHLRKEINANWPDPLSDRPSVVKAIVNGGFSSDNLNKYGISAFVDIPSLEILARILGYHLDKPEQQALIFTYPPFNKHNFSRPVYFNEIDNILMAKGIAAQPGFPFKYSMNQNLNGRSINYGYDIANILLNCDVKRTIHLGVYQENAIGYRDIIMRRTP
jgi:hypothetical protein